MRHTSAPPPPAISPTTSTCHNGLLRSRRWAKMRATSRRRPAPSSAPPVSQATTCVWKSMSAVGTQQKAPSTVSRRTESSGAREMREASIALNRAAEIPSRSMITLQVWPATTSFSSARMLRSSGDSGRTGASIVSARRGRVQPRGCERLGAVEVLLYAARLAVLDRDDVRQFHLHRGAAVSPVPRKASPDEHEVSVDADLERLDAQVGIRVKPALVLLSYGLYSAVDRVVGVLARVDVLAVRKPRGRRILLTVEPVVAEADEVFDLS